MTRIRTFSCLLALVALCGAPPMARAEIDWDENPNLRGKPALPGPYETRDDRLMEQYAGPGVLEHGDAARILWRRAMGPHGGYNDMAGAMGPAALKLVRKDDRIFIHGGNFRLYWLTSRGGEIGDISLFDGGQWFPVIHHKVVNTIGLVGTPHNEQIPVGFRAFRADTLPNFTVESPSDYAGNSPLYFLGEDKQASFEVKKAADDEIDLVTAGNPATFSRLRCPLRIQQKFRIFAEGVVLCDFTISLEGKEPCTLREMGVGGTFNDALYADLYQDCPVHFMSRMGGKDHLEHKKFFTLKPHLVLNEHLPYFGLSFAFPGRTRRSFSNSMEMILEQPAALGGGIIVTKPFYSKFDPYSMQYFYSLAWGLYASAEGKPLQLQPPFSYSNRYALAFGSHRYGTRPGLPRSMRNNLAGQRLAWWNNAAEGGKTWYPTDGEIDRLASQGLEVLLLGRNWMRTPGAAGKTPGDCAPADPGELKRVLDACHAKSIRVGLSMLGQDVARAVESNAPVGQVLKRDFDGILVEEVNFLAPDSAGASSAFLVTRQLRQLVGEKGFLIGASDIGPATIALANFDACIPARAHGDRLKGTLDEFVYYSFLNSCGSILPTSADPRTIAYGAGLGSSFVRIIESRKDLEKPLGAVSALWKQLGSLDRDQVTVFNGLTEQSGAIRAQGAVAQVILNGRGQGLLVAANPTGARTTARIAVNPLGIKLKTTTRTLELAPDEIQVLPLDP